MMHPAKMSKIRLIFSAVYYSELVSALHDLGAVQIDQVSEETTRMLGPQQALESKRISQLAQRFRSLESLLHPVQSDRKFLFESIWQLEKACESVKIDERAAEIRKELNSIAAEAKDLQQKLELLEKIKGLRCDISVLHVHGLRPFLAGGKGLKRFESDAKSQLDGIFIIGVGGNAVVCIDPLQEKDFAALAERSGISLEAIPDMEGVPAALVSHSKKRLVQISEREKALSHEINVISESWYPLVGALREQLDLEMEQQEIANRIGMGVSVAVVEGWVPADSMPELRQVAEKTTMGHFMLHTVKTKEKAPTLMRNPKVTRFFEFFIRFYSLPKSDEIDPTMMFAIAFPIFFGLMVGDFAYGLIMLVLSLWLLRRLKHPPAKSRLPKKLTKFITTIIGPNAMAILARAIIPGAIIAMVLGIVFNQYMGFSLPYTALVSVQASLPKFLLLAGYIGVVMVVFGFSLGFLNKMNEGETKHAAAKLGWISTAIGIVIFGLTVLHGRALGLSNPLAVASYAMIVGGIAVVLYGEGAQALMEIPSIVSHILSYVRLIGILLTSVILAGIIDLIFLHGIHHSLLLAIVGTVILVVGQLFNLVIAFFEAGIQGARLIYVEFFSKFYTGNGTQFRPFKSSRQRTLSRFRT